MFIFLVYKSDLLQFENEMNSKFKEQKDDFYFIIKSAILHDYNTFLANIYKRFPDYILYHIYISMKLILLNQIEQGDTFNIKSEFINDLLLPRNIPFEVKVNYAYSFDIDFNSYNIYFQKIFREVFDNFSRITDSEAIKIGIQSKYELLSKHIDRYDWKNFEKKTVLEYAKNVLKSKNS